MVASRILETSRPLAYTMGFRVFAILFRFFLLTDHGLKAAQASALPGLEMTGDIGHGLLVFFPQLT
jgi:hypothetical protein